VAETPWTALQTESTSRNMATESDPVDEGRRLLEAARSTGAVLRLVGGVAIRLRCPSAGTAALARSYKDVDFVGRSSDSRVVQEFLSTNGYTPDRRFNALNGHRRLLFHDEERSRQLDVLFDQFEMCHRIDLRQRLEIDADTLPLADLLLTKMQVVEANEKDLLDTLALVVDHPVTEGTDEGIDGRYVARLCSRDWGLWRTLQMNRDRVIAFADRLEAGARERAVGRVAELFDRVDAERKSLAWRLRSRVGDRVQWYELPEEVG
jgi:hypothetical protein